MQKLIEISASYSGELNNDKELQLFSQLKAHAAEKYPDHLLSSSRFEVTHEADGERHTHFLSLIPPVPKEPGDGTKP